MLDRNNSKKQRHNLSRWHGGPAVAPSTRRSLSSPLSARWLCPQNVSSRSSREDEHSRVKKIRRVVGETVCGCVVSFSDLSVSLRPRASGFSLLSLLLLPWTPLDPGLDNNLVLT